MKFLGALIVRDTSVKRDKRAGFLEAEQRWTVGHMATSLQAARMGFGFAWHPEEKIREEIAAGELKVLPLEGRRRRVRRDLPRARGSRRRGAWGETAGGDSQAGGAEPMSRQTPRRRAGDEEVDPGR